jgi:hypothetical protein
MFAQLTMRRGDLQGRTWFGILMHPLREKMVAPLDDWQRSSHRYCVGGDLPPAWLERDWLLS